MLRPEFYREKRVCKESNAGFHDMAVLPLSDAILLGSMWTSYSMGDSLTIEIFRETTVLATPIGLDCFNLGV